MKKILIIEPNTTAGIEIVKTAKEKNLEILAVTSKQVFINEYPNDLKEAIDDFIFCDFENKQREINKIVNVSKKKGVNGVVSGFEFFSDWAVLIAKKLNLPTNDSENIDAFRDKLEMSKLFKDNNIPSANTKVISKDDDINYVSFPCIVKPSKNAGSFGVVKVNNTNDLLNAIKIIRNNDVEFPHKFPLNSSILCQEILEGPEISVEVIASKGRYSLITCTQKITTSGEYFAEVGHIVPAPIDKLENQHVVDTVFSAMRVLGFSNGVAHAELILSDDGPKIIEIGARLPGDFIPNLINKSLDINEASLYLDVALGNEIQIYPKQGKFVGIKFLTTNKKMYFDKVKTISPLASDTEMKIYLKKDDFVDKSHDNMSRVGHIITESNGYLRLLYKINNEYSKIKILEKI